MDIFNTVLGFITTLTAAFAGAFAAFSLENHKAKRELVKQNISTVNQALYTIFNLWNILYQYQKEIIDPVRGDDYRWFTMESILPTDYGLTSFPANDLSFLLQSPYANTYSEVLLEEQRFWLVINHIEERYNLKMKQIDPLLTEKGVPNGTEIDEEILEELIGSHRFYTLKTLTEGIIENVDADLISLKKAHNSLRKAVSEIYPNEKLLKVDFGNVTADPSKNGNHGTNLK